MIQDILSELATDGIRLKPDEILYVDDRTLHLDQIIELIGALNFVHMWVDVKSPHEILNYMETT